MTENRSVTPLEADLDWVRRSLAPADPIRPGDRPPVSMPVWAADPPRLEAAPRRSKPMLVTAVAAVAVLVLGLAVAEGGRTRPRHPTVAGGAPVLAVYQTTIDAQSAQGSVSLSVGDMTVNLDGVADLRTGEGDLTLSLPAPIGQVEVRSTGQDYFVHVPAVVAGMAGTKPWIHVDQATIRGLVGSQLGAPDLGTTIDFSSVLSLLRGVSGQIATLGGETINGTQTTHYRAPLDVARVASALGADANTASAVTQALGQTFPVDVWIDAQGRLRQMKAAVDLATLHLPDVTLPADARGNAVVTVDLWNFGVTVNRVPPPADQVSDASSLIQALAGRAG